MSYQSETWLFIHLKLKVPKVDNAIVKLKTSQHKFHVW